MMTISFKTENAAFHDEQGAWWGEQECARILRDIAERVETGADGGRIMDANGNSVGSWNLDIGS